MGREYLKECQGHAALDCEACHGKLQPPLPGRWVCTQHRAPRAPPIISRPASCCALLSDLRGTPGWDFKGPHPFLNLGDVYGRLSGRAAWSIKGKDLGEPVGGRAALCMGPDVDGKCGSPSSWQPLPPEGGVLAEGSSET